MGESKPDEILIAEELIGAASSGDLEKLQTLLASGVDPDGISTTRAPALFAAARWQHLDAIGELLRAGADVNKSNHVSYTALVAASTTTKATQVIDALVEAGALIDAVDQSGRSALTVACKNSDPETVSRLLHHGADPNHRTATGGTPLMAAIYNKRKANAEGIVELLLSKGARPEPANDRGLTALGIRPSSDVARREPA